MTDLPSDPLPWREVGSTPGPDLLVARVRFDRLVSPRTGAEMTRTVLETPAWVNVVALTPARRLVVVRQYRFGTRAVTTEIPGGMVDPGEDHADAARRELLEETGYTAPRWRYLGCVEPNPAFQDNLCHHWLAEDATRAGEPTPDPGEDIAVRTLALDQVRRALASGEIRHSLVVCALARALGMEATRPS